jgi:hypothetical protein
MADPIPKTPREARAAMTRFIAELARIPAHELLDAFDWKKVSKTYEELKLRRLIKESAKRTVKQLNK